MKYPHMLFHAARLMLLTKTDLLSHPDFDVGRCIARARGVYPQAQVLQLSARSGAGLEPWYGWLSAECAALAERALA